MLEHYIILAVITGLVTLGFCTLLWWIFRKVDNPFDNLDDEDIKDLDSISENLSNYSGNNLKS